MVRLFNVYFPERTLLLAASEAMLVVAALLGVAFLSRNGDFTLALNFQHGYLQVASASLAIMLSMYYYDLYDSDVLASLRGVWMRLVQVVGTACVILALFYYAFPAARMSRRMFLSSLVVVPLLLLTWRKLFLFVNRSPRFAQRAVLVGGGPLVRSLASEIKKRPEWGIEVFGYVEPLPSAPPMMNGVPRVGDFSDLPQLVDRDRISRVILDPGAPLVPAFADFMSTLRKRRVLVQNGTDLYEAVAGRVPVESLPPGSLAADSVSPAPRAMLIYKRIASIVLAGAALLLGLPFLVLIAVAIRLDSPGPVIFRQKRMGQNGQIFILYKFRSMRQGADPDGLPRPAQAGDARVTRIGRWLRSTRFDELPQLYNILIGDMAFVGPRPFVPREEEECLRSIPFYEQRLKIKPGATGWAQIHQGYCASLEDNVEKLGYDLFYIKNLSVGLDILTVVQTVKIMLLGRGAR